VPHRTRGSPTFFFVVPAFLMSSDATSIVYNLLLQFTPPFLLFFSWLLHAQLHACFFLFPTPVNFFVFSLFCHLPSCLYVIKTPPLVMSRLRASAMPPENFTFFDLRAPSTNVFELALLFFSCRCPPRPAFHPYVIIMEATFFLTSTFFGPRRAPCYRRGRTPNTSSLILLPSILSPD